MWCTHTGMYLAHASGVWGSDDWGWMALLMWMGSPYVCGHLGVTDGGWAWLVAHWAWWGSLRCLWVGWSWLEMAGVSNTWDQWVSPGMSFSWWWQKCEPNCKGTFQDTVFCVTSSYWSSTLHGQAQYKGVEVHVFLGDEVVGVKTPKE